MSSKEDIVAAIEKKGNEIRELKNAKPATLKDDLKPLVAELLALKLSYKEVTGQDFDPPKEEKKAKEDAGGEGDGESKGPGKTQLNKERRKAEKAAKKAEEKAAKGENETETRQVVEQSGEDACAAFYGDSPLIQSTKMTERAFKNIKDLKAASAGSKIWVRARVAQSRPVGKGVFIVLRQNLHSIQAVLFQGEHVSKQMIKYASAISLESIVDIQAEVTIPQVPIQSTTNKEVELVLTEIHVVSRSEELPFQVEDAGRNEAEAAATGLPIVSQDNCLTYRWIDTRTPANQAIFRIQSGVCQLFREFLLGQNFVEIHTPKLIGGASEGGSNVFTFKYFDQPACLAQSPQLYKQMTAAAGGFERVFEIGPVFRAENSNTHRHLCEFTGLDFEMAIYEHYYEALDVMGSLFNFIFDGINERYQHELQLISQQYPFEPLKYLRPPLRITFKEGIDLLRANGTEASYDEDLSTPQEKELGRIVREKYGTDFYMMDKYPLSVRPFYTMPCPEDPTRSNSYDLFIRGEEIVSGAQRVHDVNLLIQRANHWKVPISSIQGYIDSFRHGAHPHAGGGIGLERVVMLFLGLKNIRKSSMFPRDPSRLFP